MPQLRRMWEKIGIFTKLIVFVMWLVFGVQQAVYSSDVNKIGETYGACNSPLIHGGQIYRLITAEFTHGGLSHIFFNACATVVFGIDVESEYGTLFYASLHIWLMIVSQGMDLLVQTARIYWLPAALGGVD